VNSCDFDAVAKSKCTLKSFSSQLATRGKLSCQGWF